MNYKEALLAALDGKKVRITFWPSGRWIKFNEASQMWIDHNFEITEIEADQGNYEWELYVKPRHFCGKNNPIDSLTCCQEIEEDHFVVPVRNYFGKIEWKEVKYCPFCGKKSPLYEGKE